MSILQRIIKLFGLSIFSLSFVGCSSINGPVDDSSPFYPGAVWGYEIMTDNSMFGDALKPFAVTAVVIDFPISFILDTVMFPIDMIDYYFGDDY